MDAIRQKTDRLGMFKLGMWIVEPASGTLRRTEGEEVVHLAPKVMDLLLILVEHQGEVVTKEDLISAVWPDTFVAETALTRSISELRHSLANGSDDTVYIETIPKRGYRLLVEAEEFVESSGRRSWKAPVLAVAAVLAAAALVVSGYWVLTTGPSSSGNISGRSLVVLPFDEQEIGNETDSLTLGVTEIITESLSRLEGMNVASGTSLTHFESNTTDLRAIAESLGVQYLIQGSFDRKPQGITVAVDLLETATRESVWSGEYLLDNENLAEISSEITREIANALNVSAENQDELGISRRGSNSFEALRYRLMADHFRNRIPDNMEMALEYYRKSLELRPSYAPAYAGLAIAYMGMGNWGEDPSWASRAQEAVSRALALNDEIPESHIANGILLRLYRRDFLAAELAFKEAIRLDPLHSNARREYALLLMRDLGRPNEALFQLTEATRLDPLLERNYIHLFELYCIRGEYDKAMDTARTQLELNPVNPLAHRNISETFLLLGEFEKAVDWAERSVRLYDFSRKDLYWERSFQLLMSLYLHEGRELEATELCERLNELDSREADRIAAKGILSLHLKDYPAAATLFMQAFDARPEGFVWPTGVRYSTYLAFALQNMGDTNGAEDALRISEQQNLESNAAAYEKNVYPPLIFQDELAVYTLRGDREDGLKYLDGLIEHGWKAIALLEINPIFEDAMEEPEIVRMLDGVRPELSEMRTRVEMQGLSLR